MLREPGSGQDIFKVSGGILWKKQITLTARNTSSFVIDSLCDRATEESTTVAGFYCDYRLQQEQTTTNIVGAILKQLVSRGRIPDYLREAFQKSKEKFGGRGLLLADLMAMLMAAIASLSRVFICLDALDECLPKYLPELLESLRDIVRESPRTKPRNWVRANRANPGLIRVGLGRARHQEVWARSGRPSSKPGLARKSPE